MIDLFDYLLSYFFTLTPDQTHSGKAKWGMCLFAVLLLQQLIPWRLKRRQFYRLGDVHQTNEPNPFSHQTSQFKSQLGSLRLIQRCPCLQLFHEWIQSIFGVSRRFVRVLCSFTIIVHIMFNFTVSIIHHWKGKTVNTWEKYWNSYR